MSSSMSNKKILSRGKKKGKNKKSSRVYPLAKFAYSFQRRLRELATPREAYHLHLADIDDTVPLKPPINCSDSRESVVWEVENLHEFDMLTLHNPRNLELISADSTSIMRLFYQLYDLPHNLIVHDSTINDAFVAQYANVYKHYVCDDLILELVDSKLQTETIFNQIQDFKVPLAALIFENCEKFDWVKLLLKCKECPLKLICFTGLFDDVLGHVNSDELAKMFNSVGRRLRVLINCETESWEDVKDRFMRVLGKKIVFCPNYKLDYYDLLIITSTGRRYCMSKQALTKPYIKKMVFH